MPTPTLQIYSAIGYDAQTDTGLSAAAFGLLLAQAEASGERRVSVRINSGGGNWQEGQSMYDLLKASALKVDTYCVGLVASAATLPFMAGTKRLIAAHGQLMIHNCASGASGGIAELEKTIAQQRAINASMAQLYATASGQSVEKCAEMMAAETFLNAEQAIALGFATGLMPDTQAAVAPPADLPTASLHSYYASLLSSSEMKHLLLPIMAAAGLATLSAASPDADIATAVQAAFTERDQAKKDLTAAQATAATATSALATAEAKVKELEEKAAAAETAAAAEAEATATAAVAASITAAVESGRILAGMKPKYEALGKVNAQAVIELLAELPGNKSVVAQITAQGGEGQLPPLTAGGAMAEINARLTSGR